MPYTEDRSPKKRMRPPQHKDEDALRLLIQQYTPYVVTIIRRICVPPLTDADVEEIASDVFYTVWRKFSDIRDPEALKAYIAQIARNAARKRRQQAISPLPLDDDLLTSSTTADSLSPDDLIAHREQIDILNNTLKTLDPIRRRCLIRYYYFDETIPSISTTLSLPLSTVKSHIYRGRAVLIRALQERGYSYEEG